MHTQPNHPLTQSVPNPFMVSVCAYVFVVLSPANVNSHLTPVAAPAML